MTSYQSRHEAVWAARGKASDQKCVDCGERADHWSQIRGTTGFDVSEYDPRCVSCHFIYDDIGAKISRAKAGVPLSESHRENIRQAMQNNPKVQAKTEKQIEAARRVGLSNRRTR